MAHLQHAEALKFRGVPIAVKVGGIQIHRFVGPQPPGIDDFQQRGVAVGGQGTLFARFESSTDFSICMVKEELNLVFGHGAPAG